jgi:DNA-directed RNA polymerase subunit L
MISDYLKKGGTITKLPPALAKGMKQSDMQKHKVGKMGVMKAMKMKEVRDFVDTYNKHFLTNWAAEELIEKKNLDEARYEVSHDYGSRFGSYGVTLTAVVDATSPQDAMKKGHDKLEKLSMSAKAEKLGVDELQDPDDEGKPSVKMTSKPVSFTDMKKF